MTPQTPLGRLLADPIADVLWLALLVVVIAILYKRPQWQQRDEEGHQTIERARKKKRFG